MEIDFKNLNINSLHIFNAYQAGIVSFISEWFSDPETVQVQTSGSTGAPKIFEIEKKRMLNSAEMTCDFLGLKQGDTALLCLPIEYISGKMMVVRSIFRNLKLTVAEPTLSPLKNLGHEINFCAMTPLQVEYSLDKIYLVNKLIIGGAAVSENLKKEIHQKLSDISTVGRRQLTTIYETFGMSETLSHIALRQIFPLNDDCFKTMDGVSISTDERGCLRIFAPKLNPEILQTNDLVEIKNEKEFRFLGRIDNVINSGGAKIFPEQLEALVKKEIDEELVFIGLPDAVLGQRLVLIIEGKKNPELLQMIRILKFEKSFHRPKEVLFLEKIPRLPNGKIDRISLKNLVI